MKKFLATKQFTLLVLFLMLLAGPLFSKPASDQIIDLQLERIEELKSNILSVYESIFEVFSAHNDLGGTEKANYSREKALVDYKRDIQSIIVLGKSSKELTGSKSDNVGRLDSVIAGMSVIFSKVIEHHSSLMSLRVENYNLEEKIKNDSSAGKLAKVVFQIDLLRPGIFTIFKEIAKMDGSESGAISKLKEWADIENQRLVDFNGDWLVRYSKIMESSSGSSLYEEKLVYLTSLKGDLINKLAEVKGGK